MVRIPKGKGIGGPAKGEGSKKPRGAAFTSDNAREMQMRAAAKMRENISARQAEIEQWHRDNPGFENAVLSPKQVRDYIRRDIQVDIDKAKEIASDNKNPRQLDAIKFLTEHGIGKPKETIELSGEDGGPVQIQEIRRVIVNPGDKDPEGI